MSTTLPLRPVSLATCGALSTTPTPGAVFASFSSSLGTICTSGLYFASPAAPAANCVGGKPLGPGTSTWVRPKFTVPSKTNSPSWKWTFWTAAVPTAFSSLFEELTPRRVASAWSEDSETTYQVTLPSVVCPSRSGNVTVSCATSILRAPGKLYAKIPTDGAWARAGSASALPVAPRANTAAAAIAAAAAAGALEMAPDGFLPDMDRF